MFGLSVESRNAPRGIDVENGERHSAVVVGLKVGTGTLNGAG